MVEKISSHGMPPGTLIHVGKKRMEKVHISIIDYDEKKLVEKDNISIKECKSFADSPSVTWINIDGLHNPEVIEEIGTIFDIHPLLLEDIMNTNQRPKVEDFGKYMYFILKMVYMDKRKRICVEQISIIMGDNYVISFQERTGDVFESIRERLRNKKGRIRSQKADYLAYSLIDSIIDHYFVILENIGEVIEGLEEEVVEKPSRKTLQNIHMLKRNMLYLRRSVWPLREVISYLQRSESDLIEDNTGFYLRDVYDHTIQVIDTLESFRDMVSGMLDIYLSSISNKMNEVMKVLTIIATIFIPLTFIAGIYGMNFAYMPELQWKWGYFVTLGVMIGVFVGMIIYFKRKKWF